MDFLSKIEEATLKFKVDARALCARSGEAFYVDKIWVDEIGGPNCVIGTDPRFSRRYLYYGGKWAKLEKI